MSNTTEHLGFKKPLYGTDPNEAANLDALDAALFAILTALGGLSGGGTNLSINSGTHINPSGGYVDLKPNSDGVIQLTNNLSGSIEIGLSSSFSLIRGSQQPLGDSTLRTLATTPVSVLSPDNAFKLIPLAACLVWVYGGSGAPVFGGLHTGDLVIYDDNAGVGSPLFIGDSQGLLNYNSDTHARTQIMAHAATSHLAGSSTGFNGLSLKNIGAAYSGGDDGGSNTLNVCIAYLKLDSESGAFK